MTALQADALVDAAIERARQSAAVIRWERAPRWVQGWWVATCWQAIWRELVNAYAEQRSNAGADENVARINWRLTQDDVDYAERMALWTTYECEFADWRRVPENAAAMDQWDALKQRAGSEHREPRREDLPAVVLKRLDSRPRRPDRLEVPVHEPTDGDWPRDWPGFTGLWTDWIDRFLHRRRIDPQRALPLEQSQETGT